MQKLIKYTKYKRRNTNQLLKEKEKKRGYIFNFFFLNTKRGRMDRKMVLQQERKKEKERKITEGELVERNEQMEVYSKKKNKQVHWQ